ncbi:hypothetical protein [Agarilytica rhodophyticola]|uniref:hypothetical protein n=1 Tax=Agarilytica rhodophyticola TaxID=1737490 RepID=UPI000B344C1E|nr:hypothetical protein [Agarilytica rhodophyticola]
MDKETVNQRDLTLAERCKKYLQDGPPPHMEDYVPESLTEIIIAHGAQSEPLNDELKEIGSIIQMEADDTNDIEDEEIRGYMREGFDLLAEVLNNADAS